MNPLGFFLTASQIHFKRLFSLFGIVLCIEIITVCAVSFLLQKEASQILVGMVFDNNSSLQCELVEYFAQNGQAKVIPYENAEQLKNDVRASKLECGYIIYDIDTKLSEASFSEFAAVIQSPASTVTAIINEIFYSSVLKAVSPSIVTEYANGIGLLTDESGMRQNFEAYYQSGSLVSAAFQDIHSLNTEENPTTTSILDFRYLLHGLAVFLSFIFSFFTLVLFHEDCVADALSFREKNINLAAEGFALFFGNLVIFAVNLLLIFYITDGVRLFFGIIMSLGYSLSIACLGMFIRLVVPMAVVNFSYVLIINILFGNFFINLSELNQPFYILSQSFLSTHYLNGISNDQSDEFLFLLLIALLFLLFIIVYRLVFEKTRIRE